MQAYVEGARKSMLTDIVPLRCPGVRADRLPDADGVRRRRARRTRTEPHDPCLGTADKADLEKVHADEAAVLAVRGPQLPDAAALRRHAPAHLVLDGRGRVRRAAHAPRRLPVRAGRGAHRSTRPAGEALPAARLPRRGGPLGRHGLLPAADERRSGRCWRRSRARSGTTRSRAARAPRPRSTSSSSFSDEQDAQGVPAPGHEGLPLGLAGGRSRPPRPTTTRAASPRSSASSGPRTPAATTCTATSSSARTARKASLVEPYTTLKPLGSDNPEDLWKWMAATEEKTGSEVLAIAHNGNLSNGIMFPMVEAFGKKLDKELRRDARQVGAALRGDPDQGDRRGAPLPLAERRVRRLRALGQGQPRRQRRRRRRTCSSTSTRARRCKNGLVLEAKLGTNPYKFGMIGSSDAHTGLAAMEEENFFGKTAPQEPSPERMTKARSSTNPKTGVTIMDWEVSSSGYAAVWATENTREAIFDAMQRRETYATTGPRMMVRFFGGWDFEPADANNRMPAAIGYAKGVPMGGDLSERPEGQVADVHRRGAEGPHRREPRPHPDHQGLGRQGRQDAGARLRRGRLRRAQDRGGRPLQDRRSAPRSTSRTRPGPTPSARRS